MASQVGDNALTTSGQSDFFSFIVYFFYFTNLGVFFLSKLMTFPPIYLSVYSDVRSILFVLLATADFCTQVFRGMDLWYETQRHENLVMS